MLNYAQWGIGVDNIAIRENMVDIAIGISTEITSCDYL